MATQRQRVAGRSDLADGDMRDVKVGDVDVLLVRLGEKYHALSPTCTHYGAQLSKGALSTGRIICPWHHACFDARSGNMVEPPALDHLCIADVALEGDDIVVTLPDNWSDRRGPSFTRRDPGDARRFVIVGGGAAGYCAVQTLREDGYRGRITMISDDARLPYDRANLSKQYLQGKASADWMPLRPASFYSDHDIEVLLETRVTSVDARAKSMQLSDGSTMQYDAALIATGGTPRSLDILGSDLANVFLLRSYDQADSIIETSTLATHAVVVGASFIGMEAAGSLRKRGLDVTVVAPGDVPFERTLGRDIGSMFRSLHEENGVRFALGRNVVRIQGEGRVERVVLDDGTSIDADIVVAGVGVAPATSFLKGVELDDKGAVVVDEHLRAAEGLYAAGDIASFVDARTKRRMRIEHWRTAEQHGILAARNMNGGRVPNRSVPFFWTEHFGKSLRYVGHAESVDDVIIHGDLAAKTFIAYFVENDVVTAVAGMQRDKELAEIEAMMAEDRMPAPASLR